MGAGAALVVSVRGSWQAGQSVSVSNHQRLTPRGNIDTHVCRSSSHIHTQQRSIGDLLPA